MSVETRGSKTDPARGEPKICIVSFSDISWDSRVLRQIEYASRKYTVDVIGYGAWTPTQTARVRFHALANRGFDRREKTLRTLFLLLGCILRRWWIQTYWMGSGYRKAYEWLRSGGYSIIHANDLEALPMAVLAGEATGAKVLFDAHEYSPAQVVNVGRGRLIKVAYVSYLLRIFGRRAEEFVTVCEEIASLYRENFGLDVKVIMNAASRKGTKFRPVDPNRVKLIHHGAAKPARKLERMIELVRALDERFSLHFMLIGQDEYLIKLRNIAAEKAPGRIVFKDAVPPDQIISHLSDFDMSLCLIPPVPVSYKYALPNKFFESVAAGLAIVTGPSPEMARLTRKHGFGVVAPGFEPGDVANVLNGLSDKHINDMKARALEAAEILNADVEMGKLLDIYGRLIGK